MLHRSVFSALWPIKYLCSSNLRIESLKTNHRSLFVITHLVILEFNAVVKFEMFESWGSSVKVQGSKRVIDHLVPIKAILH